MGSLQHGEEACCNPALRSYLAEYQKNDKDDQDGANGTDATVAITIANELPGHKIGLTGQGGPNWPVYFGY